MTFEYSAALMKEVPGSYAGHHGDSDEPVDARRAVEQHRAYREALESSGLEVTVLPASDARPDSVFVEDAAVVRGERALVTRPMPPRDRETGDLERHLRRTHEIERVEPPGRLEGGDVLHAARETFVGLSTRTNEEGARQLRAFLAPEGRDVTPVAIDRSTYIHLKSGSSFVGDGVILTAPGIAPGEGFEGYDTVTVPGSESNAANALRVGETVLVPARCPRAAEILRDRLPEGVKVRTVDISEFEKGGGSLSCLSVLW